MRPQPKSGKAELKEFFTLAEAAGVKLRAYELNGHIGLVAEGRIMPHHVRVLFDKNRVAAAPIVWGRQQATKGNPDAR
jgi:hypothetical protein